MTKKTKKAQPSKAYRPPPSKNNIGRPQDDELETFFMRKLRSGKLQAISAESQAEIECYHYEDSLANEEKLKGDENYSEDKVSKIVQWFQGIDKQRFHGLWQSFINSADKWEFQEIFSIADFPEYLFCDECDLCYVLHSALTSQIPELRQKNEFANDQLLFFELLCFATRDQISFRLLKSMELNMEAVMRFMEQANIKASVIQYSREVQDRTGVSNQLTVATEDIPRQLRKGEIKNLLHKVDSAFTEDQPEKSKKIEKKTKETKSKRGRPKKRQSEVKDEELLSWNELESVLQKLVAHMIRAYAYIYPAEARKKQVSCNAISQTAMEEKVEMIQ